MRNRMEKLAKLSVIILLTALLLVPSTASFAQGEEEPPPPAFVLTFTQNGQQYQIGPIEGTQSAEEFYGYSSASAHTPHVEDYASRVYLYRCTTTGELSLVMHHAIDNGALSSYRVDFDLEGVPSGANTALSDDPSHHWTSGTYSNDGRDGYREFDLTQEPEGNWWHDHNSDGGVISGLPADESWSITITPSFIEGIDSWEFVSQNQTAAVEYIALDMDNPITTAQGTAGASGCFIATAAYGSSLAGHVDTLRTFRDRYLVPDGAGSGFVSAYYDLSPSVAQLIDDHPAVKPVVRAALLPAVATSTAAVNTPLAGKIAIAGSLALASIVLAAWAHKRQRRSPA
jgi:hypothetical protein